MAAAAAAASLSLTTPLFSPPKLTHLSPNPNPRNPNPNGPNPNPRARGRRNSRISASRNGSPPETECPVPWEQQPVNEYQSLSTSVPFSWASAELPEYLSRLVATGAVFALLVGLPVAALGTRAPVSAGDHLRWALGATSTGLLAVTLAVLRMYLGWAYVGNRLLSATVEYEETGWYDGQIWVKTPEVLARDRLLGSFSVKPVLSRVKITLVGLAAALVTCVFLFINIENPKDIPEDTSRLAIAGAYNDASARSFEPDAFCGEPDFSP